MSNIITPTELQTRVRTSLARYTVIDNQTGQVYEVQSIKEKELKPTGTRIGGKKDGSFDMGGGEWIDTKWYVESPGQPFKNWWNTGVLRHPRNSKKPLMVTMWILALTAAQQKGIAKMGGKILSKPHAEFFSVEIKGMGMVAYYNQDFKLRFFLLNNGKEIWV